MRRSSSTDNIKTYRTREVADALGFSTRHVRDLIEAGELVAFDAGQGKIRPVYRVTAASLATFIRRRKAKPTKPRKAAAAA